MVISVSDNEVHIISFVTVEYVEPSWHELVLDSELSTLAVWYTKSVLTATCFITGVSADAEMLIVVQSSLSSAPLKY